MYSVIGTVRSRAFRPMWVLEELEQAYEIVPAAPASAEAKSYNPLGKIPALVDDDAVLTDSVAIMTYLADKHQALTATPGTPARAEQDAVTFWAIDQMDALLWAGAKHTRVFPETARVPAILPSLRSEFARNIDTLEGMIKGPFLMGEAFTIADILAVHCLNWAIGVGFPVENDAVAAYGKRARARPAFRAVRARDTA